MMLLANPLEFTFASAIGQKTGKIEAERAPDFFSPGMLSTGEHPRKGGESMIDKIIKLLRVLAGLARALAEFIRAVIELVRSFLL